jgi:hypothetical protein
MMPAGSFGITLDIRIGRKLRRCGLLVFGGTRRTLFERTAQTGPNCADRTEMENNVKKREKVCVVRAGKANFKESYTALFRYTVLPNSHFFT